LLLQLEECAQRNPAPPKSPDRLHSPVKTVDRIFRARANLTKSSLSWHCASGMCGCKAPSSRQRGRTLAAPPGAWTLLASLPTPPSATTAAGGLRRWPRSSWLRPAAPEEGDELPLVLKPEQDASCFRNLCGIPGTPSEHRVGCAGALEGQPVAADTLRCHFSARIHTLQGRFRFSAAAASHRLAHELDVACSTWPARRKLTSPADHNLIPKARIV